MHRSRAALVGCLLTGLALAVSAPAAPAVEPVRPYSGVEVAAADSGETVVVWRAAGAIQAAIGTPGAPFSAPVTIAPGRPATSQPIVRMDAAGDVVIVWEASATRDCDGRSNCRYDSLGVFASIRPAGAPFRPPVRLLAPQPLVLANPAVAMNRAGNWVIAMNVGASRVVGAGSGTTPPTALGVLPLLPGIEKTSFALDEAGNATFAGPDAAYHPATIVRAPDGTLGPLTVLDDASLFARDMALGVGPQGHAVAIWPGGDVLRWASRQPGGGFGAPTSSGIAAIRAPEWIGVDAQGRTITIVQPTPVFPARFTLQAIRGTVGAPFGAIATLTAADRDVGGPTRFAMSGGGTAAIGWLETNRFANPATQAALAFDAGPFGASRALTSGTSGTIDTPAVATDGAGRAVLAWSALAGGVQRILVATATQTAVAGPTVVTQAATITPPGPQGYARADSKQILNIRADNTIRPKLRCAATTTCKGTLRIYVRSAPGRPRIRLGSHHFVFRAGRVQRVTVRATRAARRAAARRSLRGTITVTSTITGGGAARKKTVSLTVKRRWR